MSAPKNFYNAVDQKKLGIDDLFSRIAKTEDDIINIKTAVSQLLPLVDSEDNGKILQVINGIWDKSQLDITTIANNINTIQKTFDNLLNPPETILHEFDFTQGLNDLVESSSAVCVLRDGATRDSEGVHFNDASAWAYIETVLNKFNLVKIEFGYMNLANFPIMGALVGFYGREYYNRGTSFAFKNDDFGLYDYVGNYQSVGFNFIENINKQIFVNGSLSFKFLSNTNIDVYINDQYIANIESPYALNSNRLVLGATTYSAYDMTIKKVTIRG